MEKNNGLNQKFLKIAGPCAVESYEQLSSTAEIIKNYIDILRGGAFKPRSNPDSFQGLGSKGLAILRRVGKEIDKPTITEVLDPRHIDQICEYCDYLQIGARNMQNFELLKEVGKTGKTVVLKRGMGAKVSEWIAAAEYIRRGCSEVILCERGIRTFEDSSRFTLDLAGALVAKNETGLKVIVDPSHATGRAELIRPLTLATRAAGLDGVMIEVHCSPAEALCDADQALLPQEYIDIIANNNF